MKKKLKLRLWEKEKKKHRGKERRGWDQILGGWPRPSRFCCRCPSSAALIEWGRSGWRFSRAFPLRNVTYNTPRPHHPYPPPPQSPRFFHNNNNQKKLDKSDRPSTRHHLQSPCIARFERTNEPWRFSPMSSYERKIFSVGFWLFFFGIYASYSAFPFKFSRWVLVCILAGLCLFSSPLFLLPFLGGKRKKKSLKSCLIVFFRRGVFAFDFFGLIHKR